MVQDFWETSCIGECGVTHSQQQMPDHPSIVVGLYDLVLGMLSSSGASLSEKNHEIPAHPRS
jgi:hypothetical protein